MTIELPSVFFSQAESAALRKFEGVDLSSFLTGSHGVTSGYHWMRRRVRGGADAEVQGVTCTASLLHFKSRSDRVLRSVHAQERQLRNLGFRTAFELNAAGGHVPKQHVQVAIIPDVAVPAATSRHSVELEAAKGVTTVSVVSCD